MNNASTTALESPKPTLQPTFVPAPFPKHPVGDSDDGDHWVEPTSDPSSSDVEGVDFVWSSDAEHHYTETVTVTVTTTVHVPDFFGPLARDNAINTPRATGDFVDEVVIPTLTDSSNVFSEAKSTSVDTAGQPTVTDVTDEELAHFLKWLTEHPLPKSELERATSELPASFISELSKVHASQTAGPETVTPEPKPERATTSRQHIFTIGTQVIDIDTIRVITNTKKHTKTTTSEATPTNVDDPNPNPNNVGWESIYSTSEFSTDATSGDTTPSDTVHEETSTTEDEQ